MRGVQDRPEVPRAPDPDAKVRADEEDEIRVTLFVLGAVAGLLFGILIMGLKVADAYDYINELETSYDVMNRRFYQDFYDSCTHHEYDEDNDETHTNAIETYLH